MTQFIAFFFYPLGIAILCLVLIFILKHNAQWSRLLCALAFLVLFLAGNRLVADTLLWQLEKQFTVLGSQGQADVIIVLGGITRPPSRFRQIPEVSEGGDRLTYAAHLYKEGRAPTILVSGGRVGSDHSEADSMASFLMMLGVPDDAILREPKSRNTEENAMYSKELMLKNGLSSSFLVTSASHMRRASRIFQHNDIKHIPAPTDYETSELHYHWQTDSLPEARHLAKTTGVIKEYLGYLYLRIKGY